MGQDRNNKYLLLDYKLLSGGVILLADIPHQSLNFKVIKLWLPISLIIMLIV